MMNSAHDFAERMEGELKRLGTSYEAGDDSATVAYVRASDGRELVRVADGCGSEWFGDRAACVAALRELQAIEIVEWDGEEHPDPNWQAGWDSLGPGVDEPENWEFV